MATVPAEAALLNLCRCAPPLTRLSVPVQRLLGMNLRQREHTAEESAQRVQCQQPPVEPDARRARQRLTGEEGTVVPERLRRNLRVARPERAEPAK